MFNNLLVDELNIQMENTGGYAFWTNGNNESQNRSIHKMVKSGLLDSNQHENEWFCASETSEEGYR